MAGWPTPSLDILIYLVGALLYHSVVFRVSSHFIDMNILYYILLVILFSGCATPPPKAMCEALVTRVEAAHSMEEAEWAVKRYDKYGCHV